MTLLAYHIGACLFHFNASKQQWPEWATNHFEVFAVIIPSGREQNADSLGRVQDKRGI